ncbi:MAG: DUF1684 domain-containing protein [Bacteroidota bacterium]|nr:DUF1684 domain-containing protein [Bacteroidota bacterium]
MIKKYYSILFAFVLFALPVKGIYGQNNEYIPSIEKSRAEKDVYMRDSASSPFNFKGKVQFEPLKYFPVDTNFVFKSKLIPFQHKDTVQIYGTKGEGRKVLKYGYVTIEINKKLYRINVYKGTSKQGEEYYSIWFTDKTTGHESYYVGRYIDFELNTDKDFIYTIDFNLAYNPYCAYSYAYSCAIPPKEEYIPVSITAGEKIFHNAETE